MADEIPVPLAVIRRAQSEVLEVKKTANYLANIKDGMEPKELPPSKPKPQMKKAKKPWPVAHNSDIHSPKWKLS